MDIKYLIIDVDGTLTDGGIYYDNSNNEIKKFSTKDGTGLILTRAAGITPIVLTGRECKATLKRMTELGVTEIYQGVTNKAKWIKEWIRDNNIEREDIGYIGDDVNDIGAMRECGFVACPANAISEVKTVSNFVSSCNGGEGVVRDTIKYILTEKDIWEETIRKAYDVSDESTSS